jgi:hydroxymethylglutaryl-CoA lyase/(R)-citramalyl-CoA lyase
VEHRATICDVGPRDGLQSDNVTLDPGVRAELCRRLADAGLPRVEAASFVHPGRVPQMAGAEQVVEALEPRPDVRWAGLVLNERGLERALATAVDEVHLSYGVTDSFTEANQGMTASEAAGAAERLIGAAHAAGRPVSATLSVAFGCPYEGEVDPGLVIEHAALLGAAGADEVLLADTIGVGVPSQVRRLVPAVAAAAPGARIGLHLHDTRGTGLANADAALECGVSLFDASVAGLGGCPFAPGSSGNIATEDVVYMLERMNVATGIDLDALLGVAAWLEGVLGRDLPGRVLRAGPFPARRAA